MSQNMSPDIIVDHCPVRRISPADGRHYFFGYFDKFPYDKSGRRLLGNRIDFTARQPEVGETSTLGWFDLTDNCRFHPFAETLAWNWQQGSMLQFLNDADDLVIYNDREDDHFVARIFNLATGKLERTLHRPIYCLSPDGRWALSVNFSRLDRERPGYGYNGAYDPFAGELTPENDGIWLIDLKQDTSTLIFSLAAAKERFYRSDMEHTQAWFNHLLFSPDSKRFGTLHRWRLWEPDGEPTHGTHMYTGNIDGSDLWPLNTEGFSSHYTWISPTQIINYSRRFDFEKQYYLYTDRSHRTEVIAKDVFPGDGHCAYSPDGKWMMTDSYPLKVDNTRRLFLYHLASRTAYEVGKFYADPAYPIPTRCDLHPNWSRDGRKLCIDSIHEGFRGIYEVDVSSLTGGER